MKDALPPAAHREHPVRRVTVQKKTLKENTDLPMEHDEGQEWEGEMHGSISDALRRTRTQPGTGHVLVRRAGGA
jgi:hypothetical protein